MIDRYAASRIALLQSDTEKLLGWQAVELAVIRVKVALGRAQLTDYETIEAALEANPPNIEWWKQEDDRIHHDLNAFINERRRFLPSDLQYLFHEDMTSYDTEEAAFALTLLKGVEFVLEDFRAYERVADRQALTYRHTLMLGNSHGQWAKLATLGGTMLTWRQEFFGPLETLLNAQRLLAYSRLSGAIGNYGSLSPEIEEAVLKEFGLEPFYGATQILPRTMYAPAAQSLLLFCEALEKVANDIRLAARSGMTKLREPFKPAQMGSSAMPHKRNPIVCEQMEGMLRLAEGYASAIVANCRTWERRAIEQSCVERVAWFDLFHVVLRMIGQMTKVLDGLKVYADQMLREVVEARGTYASDEAKNFLAKEFAKRGVGAEVAYHVIQVACFDVFEPSPPWRHLRESIADSLEEADARLMTATRLMQEPEPIVSIKEFIPRAELFGPEDLAVTESQLTEWNNLLRTVFADVRVRQEWDDLFRPSRLLSGEEFLFEKLLDA